MVTAKPIAATVKLCEVSSIRLTRSI